MTNAIIPAIEMILLTNAWITTATITPHYNGETNFDSTTVLLQRAEWIEKVVHVSFSSDGTRVEGQGKSNQKTVVSNNTPISRSEPFWYEGTMYRFIPTNAPERLTVIPFRYRQDIIRAPVPPLPPR